MYTKVPPFANDFLCSTSTIMAILVIGDWYLTTDPIKTALKALQYVECSCQLMQREKYVATIICKLFMDYFRETLNLTSVIIIEYHVEEKSLR